MDGVFLSPLNAAGFQYAILSFDRFYPTGRIELVGDSREHMEGFLKALNKEGSKVGSLAAERGTRYYLFNQHTAEYKEVEKTVVNQQDEEDGQKLLDFIDKVEAATKPSEHIERLYKIGDYPVFGG